jgi:RNA polymerase sigma-70 factor (ECF subfamily)
MLAASQSDIDAFAAFYRAHDSRLLGFFRRRSGSAEVAFDLFAETFATALERRHQFRGSTYAEEEAWLFSIARSQLLHYWRDAQVAHAAVSRLGVEVPPLEDPDIERIEEVASLSGDLNDALADLPGSLRRAVELRVIHEADYAEVSATLGISIQSARMRVSRGLRALGRRAGSAAGSSPAA